MYARRKRQKQKAEKESLEGQIRGLQATREGLVKEYTRLQHLMTQALGYLGSLSQEPCIGTSSIEAILRLHQGGQQDFGLAGHTISGLQSHALAEPSVGDVSQPLLQSLLRPTPSIGLSNLNRTTQSDLSSLLPLSETSLAEQLIIQARLRELNQRRIMHDTVRELGLAASLPPVANSLLGNPASLGAASLGEYVAAAAATQHSFEPSNSLTSRQSERSDAQALLDRLLGSQHPSSNHGLW